MDFVTIIQVLDSTIRLATPLLWEHGIRQPY